MFSRTRMWVWLVVLQSISVLTFAQVPATAPLVTNQLKPDIFWISGGGGNSGVIIGDKGVIVIDAKISAESGKQLLEEIAKITTKPVKAVILTHSDGDHVNGLASFPEGIRIIAHENNRKEQEQALAAGGRGAPPVGHLPTEVLTKNKESFVIEGVKFEGYHWGPAHTSGDLVIYLPKEKLVFTGDLTANGDPRIHSEKGGTTLGWITTSRGMLQLDSDQFVPGHGMVLSKSDIQAKLTQTEAKRAKIQALVKQGKSLEEIKSEVGDDPPGGGMGAPFPSFTELVFQESMQKP